MLTNKLAKSQVPTTKAPSLKSQSPASLKRLAIHGTVWTVLSYGGGIILRQLSSLVLTRLLTPELFGLMALVSTFLTGLGLFSDIGLVPSIIRSPRGDEEGFLNTAWTIQVIRGFGLWLFCILLAIPVANAYSEPRLMWLIPIVGFNSVISGFHSMAQYKLGRQVALGKLSLYEFGVQFVSIAVTVIWSLFNPSIWALVAGGITSAMVQLIWSHRLVANFACRFVWDASAVREIYSFGKWIFLSTTVTFFAEQIDRLLFGKIFSFELLGIYGIALTYADLPRSVTSMLSGKVIFPILSKVSDLPKRELLALIEKNRRIVLLVVAVILTGLAGFGDFLVLKLYDPRYVQAAWMLPILAIGIWPRVLCNTNEPVLLAIGKPQYSTAANFSRVGWTAGGMLLGSSLFGIPGVIAAIALNDLCYYGAVNYGLWKEKLSSIKQDFQMTLLLFGMLGIVIVGRLLLHLDLPISKLFS
jgi:O-antigen/teichoic acid export membrane protein